MSQSFEDAEWKAAERTEEENVLRKAHRYSRELERKRESARRWTAFYLTLLLTGKAQSGEAGPGKAEPVVDKPAVVEPAADKPAAEALHTIENCRISYYCPCSRCCGKWADGVTATGAIPVEGVTVAVDPLVVPLGSTVYIDGQRPTPPRTRA